MNAWEQVLGGPAIEVVAKATRRRFTVEYKRKIVREADGCKTPGAVGALLRREALYSSHLTTWRAARERGELAGAPKKRGPALLRRPSQFAPLPRRAPRRQVRRIQRLPPQQRPDRAGRLTPVGLADDLPLVLHREPPPRRLCHHLDRRPTEDLLPCVHRSPILPRPRL